VAVRIAVSTFFAGTTYFLWLAAVLLTREYANPVFRGFAWVAAPVLTGGGLAVGLAVVLRELITLQKGRDKPTSP
jgi:hypothetical protein